MNGRFRSAVFFILLVFSATKAFCQAAQGVAFYGISSQDADENMLRMTEDLYYKQLSELKPAVRDSRTDTFSADFYERGTELFSVSEGVEAAIYAVIKKQPSTKWLCTVFLTEPESGKSRSFEKEYDSYYKILMESKQNLKASFAALMDGTGGEQATHAQSLPNETRALTTDSIAGTWTGEEFVNKIVIMRGGRGFIIFKNGASMNISVKIDGTTATEAPSVIIRQTSSNNASFFPELDRKLALDSAVSANPIEWNLSITADGTLNGTKTTLVQKGTQAEESTVAVSWRKLN